MTPICATTKDEARRIVLAIAGAKDITASEVLATAEFPFLKEEDEQKVREGFGGQDER